METITNPTFWMKSWSPERLASVGTPLLDGGAEGGEWERG